MTSCNKLQILTLTATALFLNTLVGCSTIVPGATYNLTTLEAMIPATPEEITHAAQAVVEDMSLILVSADATGLDGLVVARTAQRKRVTIDIKRQTDKVSHVKIRVGTLGDQATSVMILERIQDELSL